MKFLPRRRIARVAIYLVCFVLIAIAIDMLLVQARRPITAAYDTTRILEPRMPDGSIDYLTAADNYFGHGITADNNAVPLILRALGREALPKNQPPDGITDRLSMPHLPESGDYFIVYTKFGSESDDGDLNASNIPEHWPIKLLPKDEEWVKANEKPIAALTEASQKPRYFMPFFGGVRPNSMAEIMIPHVGLLRQAAHLILTRAVLRLEKGDTQGFIDDTLTTFRLARLMNQAATLVERLVACSIEAKACGTVRAAVQAGKLQDADLRSLLASMQTLGELPQTVADCIDHGERYFILDMLQSMSVRGPRGAADLFRMLCNDNTGFGSLFQFVPVPYEQSMRRLNEYYDGAITALHQSTYPQKAQALKLWTANIETISKGNHALLMLGADWPLVLYLPTVTNPDSRYEIDRMRFHLVRVAIALELYKSSRHTYPTSLTDLAPTYLPEVPPDFFTDKPLIYSARADSYTLYSAGPNMTDDAGKGDDIDGSSK